MELPDGNRSTDRQIAQHADQEGRVVITKDRDFLDGHLLTRSPRRVLIVSTGNISNNGLLELFDAHLGAIMSAFDEADLVELFRDSPAVG